MINEYLSVLNNRTANEESNIFNTHKDLPHYNKKKTAGVLIIVHSCGSILNFCELIKSESLKMVADLITKTITLTKNEIKFCIYDNGCHLDVYVNNPANTQFENSILKSITYKVDRFHLNNHVKKCQISYNCNDVQELDDINSLYKLSLN